MSLKNHPSIIALPAPTPRDDIVCSFAVMDNLPLALGVLLEDLLDDLLLLDEESADDAVLDAVGAAGTTVGALDGLLGAGDGGVLAGAKGGDLLERVCD